MYLKTEAELMAFAGELSQRCKPAQLITLSGDLGAGKTTFVKGLLAGLGWQGPVKSPTYNLVQRYDLSLCPTYHFDLYRLADPEELYYIGWEDYHHSGTLCLVEWSEKGGDVLPQPTIKIEILYSGAGREINVSDCP